MIQYNEMLVELFKALAHPVRLQILEVLRVEPACVCHLTAVLDRPQPYVSQQLSVLREAGFVIDFKQGLYVFYRVRNRRIYKWMDQVRTVWGTEVAKGRNWQHGMAFEPIRLPDCPCPNCQAEACKRNDDANARASALPSMVSEDV
jgi:DNA-binding transcriptional ArsR family regulator